MYGNLFIAMKKNKPKKITQKDIANCIGITSRAVFNKMNHGEFKSSEEIKIRNEFFPECDREELFKKS